MSDTRMLHYIREQPEALRRVFRAPLPADALRDALAQRSVRKIWIAGSGTSWYAAMVAAEAWERSTGIDAEPISSLELLNNVSDRALGRDVAVIGISQSGATFVLVSAIRRARALGCVTVGVTAEPASLLAQTAEWVIDCATGPEDALAKTKGFTTTTLAACLIALATAGQVTSVDSFADELVTAMDATIAQSGSRVDEWVRRFGGVSAVFVVGSGIHVPTALEGALKILEVAKLPVVGREIEEMMHGAFNAVGPETGIVLLAGDLPQIDKVQTLRKATAVVGAPLVTIADRAVFERSETKDFDLVLPGLGRPELLPLLGIVPMQMLADRMAVQRGVDGDKPRHPVLYGLFKAKAIHV